MDTDTKEAIDKLVRRLDSIQKSLDLLYQDRQLFEDILGRLTAVETQLKVSRQHDNEVRNDIKHEIGNIEDRTVAAVETSIEGLQSFVKNRNPVKKSWWPWGRK